MALAIGVVKGSVIRIGANHRLKVNEIKGSNMVAQLIAPTEGAPIHLTDLERTEVVPQVHVSTARGKNRDGRTRLVFEAPREIRIRQEAHEPVVQ